MKSEKGGVLTVVAPQLRLLATNLQEHMHLAYTSFNAAIPKEDALSWYVAFVLQLTEHSGGCRAACCKTMYLATVQK